MPFARRWQVAVLLGVLVCAGGSGTTHLRADEESAAARLTFIKVFPGSTPEYLRVTVEENGQALYAGGSADQSSALEPESFRLSSDFTQELFRHAAELDYFRGLKLKGPSNVASMGAKTFSYEKGPERWEVKYNYTSDRRVQELQSIFEHIGQGRFLIQQLSFRMRFDRLGVLETLRQFEREFNSDRLVDVQQFVPVLEQLAHNTRLMNAVRRRAQRLLTRAQGAPARLEMEHINQEVGRLFRVVLEEGGDATYDSRRFAQPPRPQPLKLPAKVVSRLWELTRMANNLRGVAPAAAELPSVGYHLTYEAGSEKNEAVFHTPPTAPVAEMVHIFQQLMRQDEMRNRLRHVLENDPFMLQVVLQELEAAIRTNAVLEPAAFVPLLEGIANGSEHHQLDREKARLLLEQIQSGR
ncbi:MAG: hypothetical protein IH847_02415 [Acidobacteria bacterium]|nr:hypothetical protein [Acidobacteriota bacterium]